MGSPKTLVEHFGRELKKPVVKILHMLPVRWQSCSSLLVMLK
jgi:hypothetical protein